jgi:hypothetical protein
MIQVVLHTKCEDEMTFGMATGCVPWFTPIGHIRISKFWGPMAIGLDLLQDQAWIIIQSQS